MGASRILVVDDEPLVAEMIRRTLEDDHEVAVAHSATEALALLEAGRRYDAILCDVQMPGLDGIELHQRLREVYPDQAARMVFLSGGATTTRTRNFLASPGVRALDKPFRLGDLLARIAELIGSRA